MYIEAEATLKPTKMERILLFLFIDVNAVENMNKEIRVFARAQSQSGCF